VSFPFEFEAEYSYIGDSEVSRGFRHIRDFDENYSLLRFVYTPRIKVGILRLGANWERFGFDLPDSTRLRRTSTPDGFILGPPQIPETLQSVSAIVGLDTQFSDSILVRFEAQPGFYGTGDLDGGDFNIPFVLGGTYILSPELQFVLGVSLDYERKYPVFPGGGIRWRFASQWVLNAVLPTPRLEFEATRNLTLYAGGDLKGSTFRAGDHFGDKRADPRLNHAVLTYTEIRTGAGVEWKLSPQVKLSVEGGYLAYREFDYHRTDVRYHHDSGAPYGAIALRGAF
jgi:opacity protein-like surface antigen